MLVFSKLKKKLKFQVLTHLCPILRSVSPYRPKRRGKPEPALARAYDMQICHRRSSKCTHFANTKASHSLSHLNIKPWTHPTAAAHSLLLRRGLIWCFTACPYYYRLVSLYGRTPGECAVVLNCTEHVCACMWVRASMIPAARRRFIRFSSISSSCAPQPISPERGPRAQQVNVYYTLWWCHCIMDVVGVLPE